MVRDQPGDDGVEIARDIIGIRGHAQIPKDHLRRTEAAACRFAFHHQDAVPIAPRREEGEHIGESWRLPGALMIALAPPRAEDIHGAADGPEEVNNMGLFRLLGWAVYVTCDHVRPCRACDPAD